MNINRNNITLVGLGILLAGSILQAEPMEILKNPVLEIKRVLNTINIDGDLTDSEWGQAKGTDYFLEIEPGDNIAPQEKTEVKVAYEILKSLHLRQIGPELISCPTCGRCQVDIRGIVEKVESKMSGMFWSYLYWKPNENELIIVGL